VKLAALSIRKPLDNVHIDNFLNRHHLPDEFRLLVADHYKPLMAWLVDQRRSNDSFFLGINGAQGTGKSTLADFLRVALESDLGWQVAVLSIDDFYLTRAEREALARNVHPLLNTRGVPGTHDLHMLLDCLHELKHLSAGGEAKLPRFDKSKDDRADPSNWPSVTGPVDVIILEGWCVGSVAQSNEELRQPLNTLERDEDRSGAWRDFVNSNLERYAATIFARLDALVLLKAPSFAAVYRWRLEQERKLAAVSPPDSAGIMDERQLSRFMQFYERLTRANLVSLAESADVVLDLDDNHGCSASHFRR
jgi:D-glycerate 3-kinase